MPNSSHLQVFVPATETSLVYDGFSDPEIKIQIKGVVKMIKKIPVG